MSKQESALRRDYRVNKLDRIFSLPVKNNEFFADLAEVSVSALMYQNKEALHTAHNALEISLSINNIGNESAETSERMKGVMMVLNRGLKPESEPDDLEESHALLREGTMRSKVSKRLEGETSQRQINYERTIKNLSEDKDVDRHLDTIGGFVFGMIRDADLEELTVVKKSLGSIESSSTKGAIRGITDLIDESLRRIDILPVFEPKEKEIYNHLIHKGLYPK